MKKRIVAILLVLAMALSLAPQMAFAATETETAEGSFKVGYSIVDINPYKDKKNNLLSSIPLGGYQYTTERLSYEKKLDDNGDGVVDENDGIFATCVAVTDQSGATALFFSCDLLWVFEEFQTPVLQELLSGEDFAQYGLITENILFNGSHNHFAPVPGHNYENESAYPAFAAAYKAFKANIIAQMLSAAQKALDDRAWADMYKGSIDISDYFNENNGERKQQLVGDMLNSLREDPATHVQELTYASLVGDADVSFNYVRNYKITAYEAKKSIFGTYSKPYKADTSKEPIVYYADDGTNGGIKFVGNTKIIYNYDPVTGEQTDEKTVYVVTDYEQATEPNDQMHLVEFRFADSGKQPVALINWRGHLPSTANVSQDNTTGPYVGSYMSEYTSYFQISSGMVNALRYALLQEGYRVAFLQGQAGNMNMASWWGEGGAWLRNDAYAKERHTVYGTELAQIALYALKNNMTQINADGGKIAATRQDFQTTRPVYTPFQYLAGLKFQAAYNAVVGGIDGPRVYSDLYYWVDAEGNPLIDTDNKRLMTDADGNVLNDPKTSAPYVDAEGEVIVPVEKVTSEHAVVIPGIFQANTYANNYVNNGAEGEKLALNAIMIGEEFSLVSADTELVDRYTGENGENLWDTLAEDHNAPFVLGYTNMPGGGYMPAKEAYTYNADLVDEGFAVGVYESTTTPYAPGTGEAVVGQLDIMLDFLESGYASSESDSSVCPHCGKQVAWIDLYQETTEGDLQFYPYLRSGHYYLSQDTTLTEVETVAGVNACIDLNGKTLSVYEGIAVKADSTLSVMDSSAEGTGCVVGYEAPRLGGVFYVEADADLNIYSGTYRYAGEKNPEQSSGGIVYVAGTFTMYDGLIEGTDVNHCGGAVHVEAVGRANLRGGEIKGGTAKYGTTMTVNGEALLSGDAIVENMYYMGSADGYNRLHIDGKYTGKITVSGMLKDQAIGDATNDADVSLAKITSWGGDYRYFPQIEDGKVYMRLITDYVAQNAQTGEFIYGDYEEDDDTVNTSNLLGRVLPKLPEGSRIVLLENNVPSTRSLSISKNLYLELKGRTVNGSIMVSSGKTLYVSDVATADYDLTDTKYGNTYGKLYASKISGNVVGAPATEDSNAYLKVKEGSYVSFHAVDLNVDQMVLKPDSQGLYFKHQFAADSTAAAQVESYGMAFSLTDAPTAADLAAEPTKTETFANGQIIKAGDVIYTQLSSSTNAFGTATNTSALITGIMKQSNGSKTNKSNAAMPIYGTAYIKLTTGEYILGVTRQRSLQEQVEGISQKWEQLTQEQRTGMLKMYKTAAFNRVMKTWDVANLKNPELAQTPDEQKILRVLAIGNSHTVDATNLLYKVFQAEMPEQEVMVANMYYSGCSVESHVKFAQNNEPVYVYYTNTNDSWSQKKETTLAEALHDQVWDVIILHEMNNSAGAESSYTGSKKRNLQKHIDYVKANSLNGEPTLLWNFSWANPVSQTLWDKGFPGDWVNNYLKDYNHDYDYMLSQMIANNKKYVMATGAFADVIPSGLAIAYARNEMGQTDEALYRDYTHVSDFGRLITAYTWFATITGKTEIEDVDIDVIPKYSRVEECWPEGDMTVTDEMKDVVVESANYAIANKASILP